MKPVLVILVMIMGMSSVYARRWGAIPESTVTPSPRPSPSPTPNPRDIPVPSRGEKTSRNPTPSHHKNASEATADGNECRPVEEVTSDSLDQYEDFQNWLKAKMKGDGTRNKRLRLLRIIPIRDKRSLLVFTSGKTDTGDPYWFEPMYSAPDELEVKKKIENNKPLRTFLGIHLLDEKQDIKYIMVFYEK